jgi:hypothetical protein
MGEKHMSRIKLLCGAAIAALAVQNSAYATPMFAADFETDQTANWTVNTSHAAGSVADFFFDYSTYGIPSAPNSATGSTRGLRMEANLPGFNGTGIFSGLSVSPNGQSFTGDFTIRFDAWLNSIGPFPAGGSGSTQVTGFGYGTAGATAQWAGGVQDSVHFGATAEGGSSVDYRAYSSAAATGYLPASGVFAAGTSGTPDPRNDTHPHYAGLGNKVPPAAQTAIYPSQTGTTNTGTAGMAWRDMLITKEGDTLTWHLDGLLIATVDLSTVTLGGSNILFNHYDINANSTTNQDRLIFGLIDNIRVEVIPEPSSLALAGFAGLTLLRRRRH